MKDNTEKPKNGGAGRGQGRKPGRKRETITVSLPVELVEWLSFQNNEKDRSAFIERAILQHKAMIEETIREVDRVIEEYDLPL